MNMVVLRDKLAHSALSMMAIPPPAYQSRRQLRLPLHIALKIVSLTIPTGDPSNSVVQVKTTRTLYWIAFYLRRVNRVFYQASMNMLRSTFLPLYSSLIRHPYTSDPFPLSHAPALSVTSSLQREAAVLDLFLLHRLHEDTFSADSSLHLSSSSSYFDKYDYDYDYDTSPEESAVIRDLFDFMQPRARLEDLIREFGTQAGLVTVSGLGSYNTTCAAEYMYDGESGELDPPPPFASTVSLSLTLPPTTQMPAPTYVRTRPHPNAVPFSALTVRLAPRSVAVVFKRQKTIVELPRPRGVGVGAGASAGAEEETLERLASRIVKELGKWVASESER